MMYAAVEAFAEKHQSEFEQITKIPLEGEGKIEQRVSKWVVSLYCYLYQVCSIATFFLYYSSLNDHSYHFFSRLYQNLISNQDWMDALHTADVIFVAAHSQGSIVSTHLISRLIAEGHIRTKKTLDGMTNLANASTIPGAVSGPIADPASPGPQRICCLSLCGIHLGPLAYLHKSSLVQPYIQVLTSSLAPPVCVLKSSTIVF